MLPLRQPMLYFHMATSALSNLGSQRRDLPGFESDENDCDEMNEGDARTSSPKLFACPNEGCIRVYKRYGSMVNHVAYGKCEFQPERESLLDTAKIMYSKKLWGGELNLKMGITGSTATVVPLPDSQKKEEEGWALRATKKKQKPLARNRQNS